MIYDTWDVRAKYPRDIIETLLEIRGITEIDTFINPDYHNLTATDDLLNLNEAAERIHEAIKNKESIGLFCDYDADGVCGGAIIYRTISTLGGKVIEFVPERKDGYGLSDKALDFFKTSGIKLLITVDCGIKSSRQITELKKHKVDTIVVDHHIIDTNLPPAIIVHPSLTKSRKNLELSGGGTAYMLARRLFKERGQEKWLIDLAAISSVADVVPLNHDNRILVKYGLKVLQKTKNQGLKELLNSAGLTGRQLSAYDLGFAIAPRLNAAGRIAHPVDSFNLLVDKPGLRDIATKLNKLNQIRQDMLAKATDQAISYIENNGLYQGKLIMIKGDYDEGIVGLIASKICEKYHRPAIVLSEKAKTLKGSARSIKDINITTIISKAEKFLVSFGGHSQAAGLSMDISNFKKVEKILLSEAKQYPDELFKRKLQIDALINHADFNIKMVEKIEQLSPFGQGNPKPVFMIENALMQGFEVIGKDKSHKKIHFSCTGGNGSCLMFNYQNKNIDHQDGVKFDIAFTVGINEFKGNKKVDYFLIDAKESQ